MFRPFPLYIGLRYTRAKRRNHFISFLSLASMIGIALGVAVLITVLSVMNGFDYEIHNRIFSMARQITVSNLSGNLTDWHALNNKVAKMPEVVATAPFVAGQGMVANAGFVQGVMINGVLPEQEKNISKMTATIHQGSINALKAGSFGVVLGQEIANHLGVGVGDKIIVITPQATFTPIGIEPRFKRFTVVGIFHVGEGFGYDSSLVLINLFDAQKLFQMANTVTGINVKVKDLYDAPRLSEIIAAKLSADTSVRNWTDEYGPFFKAIRMEKTTMFVVLLFIVLVAAFNLVSSLVMTVTDKQADIAILRTLGASPRSIMAIFMVQGGIIGAVGTLLGIVGGIILALNAPVLVKMLEHIFHTHFISGAVYFIDYLPSKLEMRDVWQIGVVSLVMSLLATIYPAWRAARTQPAEALRYE